MSLMRDVERENRHSGDFDLADLCREAADANDRGCRLTERMALKRIVRFISDEPKKPGHWNRLGTWIHVAIEREIVG